MTAIWLVDIEQAVAVASDHRFMYDPNGRDFCLCGQIVLSGDGWRAHLREVLGPLSIYRVEQ